MKRRFVSLAAILVFAITLLCGCGGGGETSSPATGGSGYGARDDAVLAANAVRNLAATDDFGRTFGEAGERKEGKYVGLFYFVHLGFHGNHRGIYDMSTLAADGYSAFFNADPQSITSPLGMAHYFAKPIWGYYDSDDVWVTRRQLEMFASAGIDFLCLDATNDENYTDTVLTLLKLIREYRSEGYAVPQIFFYTNVNSQKNVREIYETFYKSGEYADCMFAPNGKPLIVAVTAENGGASFEGNPLTDNELLNYFEVKESQWPNSSKTNENAVPWIDGKYPQHIYRGKTGNWINVSVAQHSRTWRFSDMELNPGRGYAFEGAFNPANNNHEDFRRGINFEYQWNTVFEHEDEIDYVFITGWNEWVAQKINIGTGSSPQYALVDLFNEEYSRDIEPMEGGYGDNFYLQMISNIRRFKYEPATHSVRTEKTMDINDFTAEKWANEDGYLDFSGECTVRDADGFPGAGHYSDASARNDIVRTFVTKDSNYLYFRIETREDITERAGGDNTWLNLLIGTDDGGEYGPLGMQYAVNRSISGSSTRILHYVDTGRYEIAGTGEFAVKGNVLQIKLPLTAFGNINGIKFKVVDNIGDYGDEAVFYKTGDSAPTGRLVYTYSFAN